MNGQSWVKAISLYYVLFGQSWLMCYLVFRESADKAEASSGLILCDCFRESKLRNALLCVIST